MRNGLTHFLTAALLATVLISSAAAKRVTLEIGDSSPAWEKLTGIDDKEYSLGQFKNSQAIVVIFTSNNCPVCQIYESRLAKLADEFGKKKVAFVAINSNKDEDLKRMRTYATEKKIKYYYVRDETQRVAKSFGAMSTPEVFLLDKQRKLAYKGAIDDDRKLAGKPQKQFLRDAIQAVLTSKKPPVTSTRPMGCTIKWK